MSSSSTPDYSTTSDVTVQNHTSAATAESATSSIQHEPFTSTSTSMTETSSSSLSSSFSAFADTTSSFTNTTIPVPRKFGDNFSLTLGGLSNLYLASGGYAFSVKTIDSLIINQSGVGLDCSDVSGGGSQEGGSPYPIDYTYFRMNCYVVNSTSDYRELLLDTVVLNLSLASPSTYKFELNVNATSESTVLPQSYNWTFGDGTVGTSNASEWIEHNYSNPGQFNTTVDLVAHSNSSSAASNQNWTLGNSFVVTIEVPETSASATMTSTTDQNITSTF